MIAMILDKEIIWFREVSAGYCVTRSERSSPAMLLPGILPQADHKLRVMLNSGHFISSLVAGSY